MKPPSTPYWDRLAAKEHAIVKTLKALVAKIIAKIKGEPALTTGGLVGIVAVVQQWIATNHITTVRQAVTLAVPIAVTFVIRSFVVPVSVHKAVVAQADAALHQANDAIASALLAHYKQTSVPSSGTTTP